MTLYEISVDLLVKIDAAKIADSNDDLLTRARTMVNALDEASSYIEGATQYRVTAGLAGSPAVETKQVTQAVSAFRGGLSKHGAAGLQHVPATNLLNAAKAQRDRVLRWVKATWRQRFADIEPLLERAEDTGFVAGGAKRLEIARYAASLRAAQNLDPVVDVQGLSEIFGSTDLGGWIASIASRRRQLQDALEAVDRDRVALPTEIQAVLKRAASGVGFPLEELTPELLDEMQRAQVCEYLVLKRL